MEKYVIIVLNVLLLSAVALYVANPKLSKRYRSDYVYNRETYAFYKLHIESCNSVESSEVCGIEGAELMKPSSHNDIVQLHSMLKQYPDLGDYVWVADDGSPHEAAEDYPIIDLNPTSEYEESWSLPENNCAVVTRSGDVEILPCHRRLPFICKVTAADAPYDAHCGVYGKDYKYYASVGSCYKIPRIAYTWSEAYAECDAVGAHLVVLDSVAEMDAVYNLTNSEESVPGTTSSWYFFAGYRAARPKNGARRIFKTLFNQTLDQLDFPIWSIYEPNNIGGNEYCGSLYKATGKLNDVPCSNLYAFVCEKEVQHT